MSCILVFCAHSSWLCLPKCPPKNRLWLKQAPLARANEPNSGIDSRPVTLSATLQHEPACRVMIPWSLFGAIWGQHNKDGTLRSHPQSLATPQGPSDLNQWAGKTLVCKGVAKFAPICFVFLLKYLWFSLWFESPSIPFILKSYLFVSPKSDRSLAPRLVEIMCPAFQL